MGMKVLVVGGGGREHAIITALSRNPDVSLYSVMAKENPGIARQAAKHLIHRETDVAAVAEFAAAHDVEYAVIGPEAPLEAGISDTLNSRGIICIGPTRAAARLETDKAFCRTMMEAHGIAGCPRYRVFYDSSDACGFIRDFGGDLAIKPIGLTGGKGVKIMGEHFDAAGACEYIRGLSGGVVLEERLIGEEFTLQAFVDGRHLVATPLVQDHKRAFEGDVGPNTGGMGSYSMPDHRMPFVTEDDYEKALAIMRHAVSAIEQEGSPYVGILYGQFMNTAEGPKVIEFNARFGDPEAMNVLSILDSDFPELIASMGEGTLSEAKARFAPKATVCKYLVPAGYPDAPKADQPVTVGMTGSALAYYANIVERDGVLYTQTSRTLAFVGVADTLGEAESVAETAAEAVSGEVRHRRDIGTRDVLDRRIAHMKELR